jgi:hypothetical protein
MSRRLRLAIIPIACAVLAASSVGADSQARGVRPRPRPPGHVAVRGHVVFVGGYFYDPHFGPYPWWDPIRYQAWYPPVYGLPASVRIVATPKTAAVYVDGFYAGIVDDFDGIFQSLPLPPGGHAITLYEPGYRTVTQRVYLSAGSTFKLQLTLERLPAGSASEPPPVASPLPPPPPHSFIPPRTPPRDQPPSPAPASGVEAPGSGYGSLFLRVQPPSAEVTIDDVRWTSSSAGAFVLDLATGSHRVEVAARGHLPYSAIVDVRHGETTSLNVALARDRS